MKVGDKKVVSMSYTLKEGNEKGEVIQEVSKERPFVYLFGQGGLLPAFKKKLEGLKEGDEFSFVLPKEDAYGSPSEDNVIDLEKKLFEVDGKVDDKNLKAGQVVPMEDENGYPFTGIILEVKDDKVKMDFNHPLAGLDLYFKGKILGIREPTEEELEHGHAHYEGMDDH